MLLHSLPDDQIISRIHKLTRRERAATLLVLLHLNEIERRQLHLALGYSSMFAFCTSGLGYSESDAGRRIQAARCIVRFPDVYGLLESNAVTIVTVSRVASILTAENKDALLARIRGRTQDEVSAVPSASRRTPRSGGGLCVPGGAGVPGRAASDGDDCRAECGSITRVCSGTTHL